MLELLWDELNRIIKDGYSITDIENLRLICKITYGMRIIPLWQYRELINALITVEAHGYVYRNLQQSLPNG